MIDRQRFIKDAWMLEGVPFLHQGTDPARGGLDCINAPMFLIKKQGVALPFDVPNAYRSDVHDYKAIEARLYSFCVPVELAEARGGDLYYFRPALNMRHIGIRVTDDSPPLLLHLSSRSRKGFPNGCGVIEPFADRWIRIFRHCFRLPFFD